MAVLSYGDLLDALDSADTPAARKQIKAALYELVEMALRPNPDPLTVIDDATNRDTTGTIEAPDLHHQHPTQRTEGRLRARTRAGLAAAALVRRLGYGGTR